MRYTCPVCLYAVLPYPPQDYHICPCCGTEFGNDDAEYSYEQLRELWIAAGARWFFRNPPPNWNPYWQLINGGLAAAVPLFYADMRFQADATIAVGQERPTYDPRLVLSSVGA